MTPVPIDAPHDAAPTAADPVRGAAARALWWRSITPGLVVATVLTAAAVASGRLPAGLAPWVIGGAAGATLTAALGLWIKCRAVAAPPDPSGLGPSFEVALFADFALNLLTVGVTLIALFAAGVKFPYLAGLALAFAAVALVHQLMSAWILSRALRERAARSRAATSRSSAPDEGGGVSPSRTGDASPESHSR